MFKHTRRYLSAASVVVAAGTAVVCGLTAASAAAPGVSGTEHFQIMTTSAAPTSRVIAYGAFTGGGADHEHEAINTDTFAFARGSFKLRHSPGQGKQTFNPRTCLLTINEHGTYTLGHGTGRYVGISGHGTYHLSILEIAGRSKGICSMHTRPAAFQLIINAQGPVRL